MWAKNKVYDNVVRLGADLLVLEQGESVCVCVENIRLNKDDYPSLPSISH